MELLNQGAIILIFLLGGLLASVAGFVLVVLYKRAIGRHMRSVVAAGRTGYSDNYPRRKPLTQLTYAVDNIDRAPRARSPGFAIFPSVYGCAGIYSAAGLVFGIFATCLLFALSGIEFLPLRTACVAWAYAWPIVLTLNLLWSGHRWRHFAVISLYAAVIGLFCLWSVFGDSRPSAIGSVTFPAFANPILLWAIYASPSIFLLLFLNRTVRAVGPVLLIFGTLVFLGWHVATFCLGTPVGLAIAGWAFAATQITAGMLWQGVRAAGLMMGALLGWLVIGRVAKAYAARRFSDQMLIVDTIWLLQALMLCSSLAFEVGAWGAAGLLAFAAYKAVTAVGFQVLAARTNRQPTRLLLLRVFGFSRRSSRLMDLIAARWRHLGSIRLIAAPDLAARTIEPGKLLAFVRGRLGRLFICDDSQLAERIAGMDERPDPDGRFRIAELFCAGEVWRTVVKSLMSDVHMVVMDLRSFGDQHSGCVFELQTLLDTVPLDRLVLLVNTATDVKLLRQVLDARWRELRADSPNARLATPTIRLMQVDRWEGRVVGRLMLEAAAIARAEPSLGGPHGVDLTRGRSVRPAPGPIVSA